MGDENKEDVVGSYSLLSDDNSYPESNGSSSGRKKKITNLEDNKHVVDGQKLFDIIITHSNSSHKPAEQFSLKDEWTSVAYDYYKTKYARTNQIRRLYNYYSRHLSHVAENTAKNVKTQCTASSPRYIRDKHHESAKTLYLKGREKKVLSIVKEIVHNACAGVVESAIRQSVCPIAKSVRSGD